MEKMQISLISVVEHHGTVVAQARAEAEQARISVEVWFKVPPRTAKRELWKEARDEVLRYLDPA